MVVSAPPSRWLTRRELLQLGLASAVYGMRIGIEPASAAEPGLPISAFLVLDERQRIHFIMPVAEMGQGISTTLASIVATELGLVSAQDLVIDQAPRAAAYVSPLIGTQSTSASISLRTWYGPLRTAATTFRTALRLPDGTRTAFKPEPHPPVRNIHSPDIVQGALKYSIDFTPPLALHAAVRTHPLPGLGVKSLNDAAAKAVAGVVVILPIPNGIAVVAESHWTAQRALALLDIQWAAAPPPENIFSQLADQLRRGPVITAMSRNADTLPAAAVTAHRATYRLPFLAHAAMEPLSCSAEWRDGVCRIWMGTQSPHFVARDVSRALNIDIDKVKISNFVIGGSFGRRVLGNEIAVQAALLAKLVQRPIKVVWDREEDMRHDRYRPAVLTEISASLDRQLRPITLQAIVCCADWLDDNDIHEARIKALVNTQGLSTHPYDIQALDIRYVQATSPISVGPWRSIGHGYNVFVVESFIDELAVRLQRDPLGYRTSLLIADSPGRQVLGGVAEMCSWQSQYPPTRDNLARKKHRKPNQTRVGLGVALQFGWDTWLAVVARVTSNSPDNRALQVTDLWACVDCGVAVNAAGVIKQIEGALLFGLSAALYGEITVGRSGVEQANFHQYRVLRMQESPRLHVRLISTGRTLIGGIGECATSAVMPAVGNAVSQLHGQRVRQLPLIASV